MPNNIRFKKCLIIMYEVYKIHYIEVENNGVQNFIKVCSICADKYFDKQVEKEEHKNEK